MTDHRAEAVRLAGQGETAVRAGLFDDAVIYVQLAAVYARLACAPVESAPVPGFALLAQRSRALDELRDAVWDYVDNVGDDEVEGAPRFARLRELVGGAS